MWCALARNPISRAWRLHNRITLIESSVWMERSCVVRNKLKIEGNKEDLMVPLGDDDHSGFGARVTRRRQRRVLVAAAWCLSSFESSQLDPYLKTDVSGFAKFLQRWLLCPSSRVSSYGVVNIHHHLLYVRPNSSVGPYIRPREINGCYIEWPARHNIGV